MINDEDLVLFYYRDGLSEDEVHEIRSALTTNEELARRYSKLRTDLSQWHTPILELPRNQAVNRWHRTIEQAASTQQIRKSQDKKPLHLFSFTWGAALSAMLMLGIGIGVLIDRPDNDHPATAALYPGQNEHALRLPKSSLARGLQVHLRQSQYDLRLPVDGSTERSELLLSIIAQNKLYIRIAERDRAMDLARVLRAFEPILIRLAALDASNSEARKLNDQLNFEFKVVLTKLARRSSEKTNSI